MNLFLRLTTGGKIGPINYWGINLREDKTVEIKVNSQPVLVNRQEIESLMTSFKFILEGMR